MTNDTKTTDEQAFDQQLFLRAHAAVHGDAATAYAQDVVRNPVTDRIIRANGYEESDEGLLVSFRLEPVQHLMLSYQADPTGNTPVFVDQETINIRIPNDKLTEIDRPVTEFDKFRFRKEYAAFTEGRDQSLLGTALLQMPGMTPAQVKELNYYGVQTVEQLAQVSDSGTHIGGLQALKRRASHFLDQQSSAANTAVQTEQKSEIDALKAQVAQLVALITPAQEPATDSTQDATAEPSAYSKKKYGTNK